MPAVTAVPILSLLAGAAFGLAAADAAEPMRFRGMAWICLAAGTLVFVLAGRRRTVVVFAGVALAFAGGGALLGSRAWDRAWRSSLRLAFDAVVPEAGALTATLSGVLRSDASIGDGVVSLSLDARSIEVHAAGIGRTMAEVPRDGPKVVRGGVQLSVAGEMAAGRAAQWRAGRTLRLPVRLRRPSQYFNDGALDGDRAFARRGTALVGSVKSGALIDVVSPGTWWGEACASARAAVREIVSRHVGRWDPTAAGVVTAILIGDRGGLSPRVERALQDAGTYHVIAISGGNVAVLAAMTLAGFRWSGTLGRTAMATAIALFLAYGQLVTGGASVNRAVTVAVLCFGARAIDQRLGGPQALALAAGWLTAVDPLVVFDPGFLLSFGATAAILATSSIWSPPRPPTRLGHITRTLLQLLLASAAAEIALMPIAAFFFGRITVAGLLLNIAAVPLMAVAQILGLLLLPVSALSSAAGDAAGWLAAITCAALVHSSMLVDWVPEVAWRVARPSGLAIAVYYSMALAVFLLWRRPSPAPRLRPLPPVAGARPTARLVVVALATAAGVWIAAEPWRVMTAWGDGRLRVTFLDVGQGDAALVQFPGGAAMLVDAGGSRSETFDVGDRVVAPALHWLGVRRLTTLVVTHGDVDHAGGAATAVRDFRPAEVWEGVPVPRSPVLRDLRETALARNATWRTVQQRDRLAVQGVDVIVHHPPSPDWERQQVRNDDSVVLELRWRDASIVLTGDIGRDAEAGLAEQLAWAPLRVVKVAHHGSASSSGATFLERARPAVAIVSVGRGNPFGHPVAAVLGRYAAMGTAIYRTDRDGAVRVVTDGHTLSVTTVRGREPAISLTSPGR